MLVRVALQVILIHIQTLKGIRRNGNITFTTYLFWLHRNCQNDIFHCSQWWNFLKYVIKWRHLRFIVTIVPGFILLTRTWQWFFTSSTRNKICLCLKIAWTVNPLQWCHIEDDGAWNHQPRDCLLNRLFRRRSKKTGWGEFAGDRWINSTKGQ